MNAKVDRINSDIEKIKQLSRLGAAVKVITSNQSTVSLEFEYRTISDKNGTVVQKTNASIEIGARYPFQEPKVRFTTPVFHPNVYTSGQVCLGTKWMPTEGLNLLVERLIKILIFDASILNTKSPANRDALQWYRAKVSSNQSFFPTDKFSKRSDNQNTPKMTWNNSKEPTTKPAEKSVELSCISCNQRMRVPDKQNIVVTCPKCGGKTIRK
jgi:ubiquitin-protein ligase/ribosomal protein S27E